MRFLAIFGGIIIVCALVITAILHGSDGFYRGEGFTIVEVEGEEPRSVHVCSYWSILEGNRAVMMWPAAYGDLPELEGYEVREETQAGCP